MTRVPNLIETALDLQASGLSVIPFTNKKPAVPWKEYQTRIPSEDEIRTMFAGESASQIAVVMGDVSGFLHAIDIDDADGSQSASVLYATLARRFPDIKFPCSTTPAGGVHLFFRSFGVEKQSIAGHYSLITGGRCIIIPPSPGYIYLTDPDLTKVPEISPVMAKEVFDICKLIEANA